MKVRISSKVLAAIRAHAASEPGREVCGLLFGSKDHVTAVSPARNIAADPAREFEIDPVALFAALRAERAGGPRLAGYYHSHPVGSAAASARDRAQASPDEKLWLILGQSGFRLYRATEQGLIEVAVS